MFASDARRASTIWRGLLLSLFAFAVFALVQAGAQNAAAQSIVRVEEDWELVITEPESNTEAPQVTCVISPVGHIDGLYSVFDLNLRHNPDYAAGGIQIQLWSGTNTLSSSSSNRGVLLETPGETIAWTQVMKLQDGDLSFQVVNGSSQTWGSFGGGPKLLVSRASGLENLNAHENEEERHVAITAPMVVGPEQGPDQQHTGPRGSNDIGQHGTEQEPAGVGAWPGGEVAVNDEDP